MKNKYKWTILPYEKQWRNTLDKEALTEYNITLSDLENRYKAFVTYANQSGFRKRVFECWGTLHKYKAEFKHLGQRDFKEIK